MNVALCSAFRNSTPYLANYIFQVRRLAWALAERGDNLYVVWGEGDSTDDTAWYLEFIKHTTDRPADGQLRGTLINVSHGGPEFGSVVDAQRFKQLAYVANKIWAQIPDDADAVIWCESDLIWDASTMLALIDRLKEVPCVAPMIMLEREGFPPDAFYDFWGFRKHDKQFNQLPPYFSGWPVSGLVQVDSAGSCLVMNATLARQVHFTEESVIVGMCEQINSLGASVWLDTSLKVVHK